MNRRLADYEATVGRHTLSQLKQLADDLEGASVLHVNSTRQGGGVAEILEWLIPLMNDLGLRAAWEVIEGSEDFFNVTKNLHNGLQGRPVALTDAMERTYDQTLAANADRLGEALRAADYVFIHDPQPAGLLGHFPRRKGRWV